MNQAFKRKTERRRIQILGSRQIATPKNHEPSQESQYVARSLMFSRVFQEVKEEWKKRDLRLPRRERRARMIKLARKTLSMMRETFETKKETEIQKDNASGVD